MAIYQIEWKKSALRELKRLDRKIVPRIISTVESLSKNPFPSGVRKLQGADNTYRVRVGEYCIIYEILEVRIVIVILRVRHRKDAYR
jgi:mRNA interferase RelE/StbE